MSTEKDQQIKTRLHPRNKNRERYDLSALIATTPELKKHLTPNKLGEQSVDFSNPEAVKLLNKALLHHYYGIKKWEFPDENLCPPIPGRADYLHYMADLLAENNFGTIPTGDKLTCLDVGVGASCIYPIIGVTEYGWKFIGSDVDPKSIAAAQSIVKSNPSLKKLVECRLQETPKDIFFGILGNDEKVDLTICNPPFHSSSEAAQKGSRRKIKNLTGKDVDTPELNFSGVSNELYCEGGESKFIENMIGESKRFSKNSYWFSTLVSKQSNLKGAYHFLDMMGAKKVKTIPMGTGNKVTRIVAWTFLTKEEQKEWREARWKTEVKE